MKNPFAFFNPTSFRSQAQLLNIVAMILTAHDYFTKPEASGAEASFAMSVSTLAVAALGDPENGPVRDFLSLLASSAGFGRSVQALISSSASPAANVVHLLTNLYTVGTHIGTFRPKSEENTGSESRSPSARS
ncbi:hypothetical protein [Legionella yabuuchiae]|uniref:hypothetical protein n=1 Tax=Legionella yabuuchiae TaxID=376727 RepID=UPI0010563FD3|nr:hypothetical protein [Legionella yabuuchiae]